uniref:Uncharacterized protein n=1 Tax=Acrobeloides nanus TaxID=290746 RepID=A0A914DZB5_9BILA
MSGIVPQNISQLSEDGEDAHESFPPDYFGEEDEENLYDSEFGSDAHNRSSYSADYDTKNCRNNDKLTTISEERSVLSELLTENPFPDDLRILSRNSKNNTGSVKSIHLTKNSNRNPSLTNVSKENIRPVYKTNPFDINATPQHHEDFSNISFKPANQVIHRFAEDEHRVAYENFLHPDQINDNMMKKQYSWEPSIMNSPPIINPFMDNSKLVTSKLEVNKNTVNNSLDRKEKSKLSTLNNSNEYRIENQPLDTNQKIQIKKPNDKFFGKAMNTSLNTSGTKLPVNRPNKLEKNLQLPDIEENKENKLPASQIDFNGSEMPASKARVTSSPNDNSRENPRQDLSLMCRSISLIQDSKIYDSPKTRPLLSRFDKDSRFGQWVQNATKQTSDTLSSSAIDRALDVPGYNTIMSNNTDLQYKLAERMLLKSSRTKRSQEVYDPKLTSINNLKNKLERQLNRSNRKKSQLECYRHKEDTSARQKFGNSKQITNVEYTARSIRSKAHGSPSGVLANLHKHLTPSRSPRAIANPKTIHGGAHYMTPHKNSETKFSNEHVHVHSNLTQPHESSNVKKSLSMQTSFQKPKPKIFFVQDSDKEGEIEQFKIPYIAIKADLKTHVYLKKNVFGIDVPIMKLLEKIIVEKPEDQIGFIKEYASKLNI